jgi:signal transduction histidine kinase
MVRLPGIDHRMERPVQRLPGDRNNNDVRIALPGVTPAANIFESTGETPPPNGCDRMDASSCADLESLKILVLEDNESDYELMKRELRSVCPSCILDWAWSKDTYLKALEHGRPHIALLDYSLPGFDGLSAMSLVRQRYPEVPVIIVSGGIGEETAIDTLKAGATDYVLKHHFHRLGPVIERAIQEIKETMERKRAEEALEASRKKFESLFSASNEGISLHEMIYDQQGRAVDYRLLDVNAAFEEITGIPRERAIGSLASEIYGTYPPPYMDVYNKVVETGDPFHFEAYYEPMGKQLMISVFSPEKNKFATMFVDVSDRKYLEAQLKKKADDLARSNAELQQFAYVASHDLQEPLRMVSAHLDMLKRRYSDQLSPEAMQHLDFAVQGALRMKALIHDLLQYSRLESRGRTFEVVDMTLSARQAITNLHASIDESGAMIEVLELPKVMADPTQLIQLFQNLISNAIKFRGEEPPIIRIAAENGGDEWVVSVKDNGIGIDLHQADRIFQMFQRLHTQDEYPGTGIGLAIAKKIVERHGGRIWVESEPGKGSTFLFTMPKMDRT